jgi:peroxiredoxin
VLAGRNRSLAVDGSADAGYRLYLDVDGDGKLTDAEARPMTLIAGRFSASFHTELTDTSSGSPETYPVDMTFSLDTAIPPGGTVPVPVIRRSGTTVRRGVVHMTGVDVPFALLGQAGVYDLPSSTVIFDLRGRGLDFTDERSPDRFQVRDGKVTIAGAVYAFRVDRYGRGLALAATDKPMPPRPTLEIGAMAPDFAFTDLDGGRHHLADYRGQVVLLVFWAAWCAPCRAEAPAIAQAYERFKDQGMVVVGINPNDPIVEARAFIEQFHVPGPTAREPMTGAAHQLFRITGWPAHFLIGRDGRILANEVEAGNLNEAVAAAVRSR